MISISKTSRLFRGFPRRRTGRTQSVACLIAILIVVAFLSAGVTGPVASAANFGVPAIEFDQNKTRVADFDVNLASYVPRLPSSAQLQALETLKANLGDRQITARWDKATGSVDTIYDFASQPSSLAPEQAARAFIAANFGLFGISDTSTLRLKKNVEALGGNLLYFEQTHNGLPVASSGIGVFMDGQRRIKMQIGRAHV